MRPPRRLRRDRLDDARCARPRRSAARSVRDGGRAPGRRRARPAEPAPAPLLVQLEPQQGRPRDAGDPHAVASSRSARTRCSTRTRRASSTSSRTRATRARWCSATASSDVWINPPPLPLTTPEMDALYELPFTRAAAPAAPADEAAGVRDDQVLGHDPARLLRRLQLLLDHRARRPHHPEPQREVDPRRDRAHPRSDAGLHRHRSPTSAARPRTCTGWRARAARSRPRAASPRACSPTSATTSNTDHGPLVALYKKARAIPGVKRILIASGVRYDLAVESPEWIRELAQHHTGGYLKIAPEHTEDGPLRHMMKPGIGAYDRFKELFDRYSKEAGKEQYLIPYFIAAHPGTTDEDMLEPRAVAQAQRLPPRSGPGVPAVADGDRDRDVPHRLQPAALAQGEGARARPSRASSGAGSTRRSCAITIRTTGRCCARRSSAWGARSDRRRQAPARAGVAARGHRRPA